MSDELAAGASADAGPASGGVRREPAEDVGSLLSTAVTPGEVLDVLTEVSRRRLGADSVNVSLLDETDTTMVLVRSRQSSPQIRLQFARHPVDAPYPTRDVLRTGRAVLLRSRQERDERYPALRAIEVNRVAWAALPLTVNGRPLGILGLGWTTPQSFDQPQLDDCQEVADLAAAALARARRFDEEQQARSAAEDLARRLGVLQSLTGQLAEATELETVGALVVGAGLRTMGADVAAVGLLEGDSTFTALATAGLPDDVIHPWSTHDVSRSAQVRDIMTRRQPVLVVSSEDRADRFPAQSPQVEGVEATATLPLLAAGVPIGLLVYGWKRPRTFDSYDIEYLSAIASNAATAIDRCRLLARTNQIAETLQLALMPEVVTRVPGWQLATCYRPALQGTQVGGDWYDAFLADDRLVLVLGDVAGKGVRAAAVMGAARSALRAYATVDPTPMRILQRLDGHFARFKPREMVTCVIAVLDPKTGLLTYASAGHLPPLVVGGQAATRLDKATTPPVGASGQKSRHQAEATVDPGQVLLLYSDGLIERRDQDLDTTIDRLAVAATQLVDTHDLSTWGTSLIATLDAPARVVDDIALLALRRDGAERDASR